jgi:UDP-glucose 4-epimerase
MRVLVTGSAGHLGEALVRTLRELDRDVVGIDLLESPFTTHVGSITDRARGSITLTTQSESVPLV